MMRHACPRAFTLVELLVVIAIIGVLMAVLLPALGRARDSAKRTVCATNLKGQGTAMGTYASSANDRLPVFTNTVGFWLQDEPLEFGDSLTSVPLAGSTATSTMKRWFYCPGNDYQGDAAAWTQFVAQRYRAFGYNYLNSRGGASYPALGTGGKLQRFTKGQPDITYQRKWNPAFAGDVEVAFDMVYVTSNRGQDFATAGPHGGALANVTSSHVRGTTPQGMNVLYLDGHVQWRVWPGIARATCIANNNTQSYVYLVDP